jgi:hypothetical protein
LGSIATQASNNVSITGGSVTGITDLAVADGGTGASDASTARTNLGLAIGSNVQAYSSRLSSIAALGPIYGDSMLYTTAGTDQWSNTTISPLGRTLLANYTAGDMRSSLGVRSNTEVNPNIITVYEYGHSKAVWDVVRPPRPDGDGSAWVLAANSASYLDKDNGPIGIVCEIVDANYYRVALGGYVTFTSSDPYSLANGKYAFLTGTGDLTNTIPSGASETIHPVLVKLSNTTAIVNTGSMIPTIQPLSRGGTGATTASGARTNLELGSIATQASNNVSITGGSVAGLTSLGYNTYACAMHGNADITISSSTYTEVVLNTDVYDTRNWSNTSTGRITPGVAGYYYVYGLITYKSMEANKIYGAYLYKNNSSGIGANRGTIASVATVACNSSGITYLNGTTDYVSLTAYHEATTSIDITTTYRQTLLLAFYIGS